MTTKNTQHDAPRSPRFQSVGFCIFLFGISVSSTGCCLFSRISDEDLLEQNRRLEAHIKIQDQEIDTLLQQAAERNAEVSKLRATIAQQSAADEQQKPGESDEQ